MYLRWGGANVVHSALVLESARLGSLVGGKLAGQARISGSIPGSAEIYSELGLMFGEPTAHNRRILRNQFFII